MRLPSARMAQPPTPATTGAAAPPAPHYFDMRAPLTRPVTTQQVADFTLQEGMQPSLVAPHGSLYFGPIAQSGRYCVPRGCGIIFFRYSEGMNPSFPDTSSNAAGNRSAGGDLTSYFFRRGVPRDLPSVRDGGDAAMAFTSLCQYYQQGDRYGGDWAGGVFHGEGVLISSLLTYQGGWQKGIMHGRGVASYTRKYVDARPAAAGNGSGGGGVGTLLLKGLSYVSPFELIAPAAAPKEYAGDFHAEHGRHGTGIMRYYNGDVYEGEWKDNCRHGKGKLRQPDGELYEGDWAYDVREGCGKIQYPNSSVFKGLMRRDLRDGEGVMRFANGDEYFGSFTADRIEGQGTMKYRNGDVYDGAWRDQLRQGKGTFTLKRTGATMTGTFQNGLIHGEATVVVPLVSTFVGTFVKGERKVGTMHWHQQNQQEQDKTAETAAAALASPPPADLPLALSTGNTVSVPVTTGTSSLGQAARRHYLCYQGEWHGEHMHGRGLLWYTNGDFFSGRFVKSLRHGPGNMRYAAEKAEFSGAFVHGVRHGPGLLQLHDGSIRAGRWQHDCFAEGYEGEWDGAVFSGIGRLTIPIDTFFGLRAANSTMKLTDLSAIWNEVPGPPPSSFTPVDDETRMDTVNSGGQWGEGTSPTSTRLGGLMNSALMRRADLPPTFIDFFGVFRDGLRDGLGLLKLPALDCLVGGTLSPAGSSGGAAVINPAGAQTTSSGGGGGAAASHKGRRGAATPAAPNDPAVPSVVIKGRWVREVLHCDKGVIAFPNGAVYIGGFRNGARDGATGRVWWPDGSVMESAWRDDAPSGVGVWYQRNRMDPIFQTVPPSALRRSRSRRRTAAVDDALTASASLATVAAARANADDNRDCGATSGDLFGLSYLWGLVGLGFGVGGVGNGEKKDNAVDGDSDIEEEPGRPQRVLIDFHGHFTMACTWAPCAMDIGTYSRVVLPQLAAQTSPLPNGTPWPLALHSPTMAAATSISSSSCGFGGVCGASAIALPNKSIEITGCIGKTMRFVAASPPSTAVITTRQLAAAATSLHLSEPPSRIAVGLANGPAVVYFESGVVAAGEWLCNMPRLAVPFRPWSAYDAFLVWQASRPAARNCMHTFPLWVAPRSQSCYTGLLANAPEDVQGEPRRTTHGEPIHYAASMVASPLAVADSNSGSRAAVSEGVSAVTSPDTRCTICTKEYGFFRKRVHCTLCLRSTCSSCLGHMDADGRRQEDVKALLRHAYATSEQATQLAAAAGKRGASSANSSSGGGRRVVFPSISVDQVERTLESQNIPTVPVCADCVRSVLWKLRYSQLWIPFSMFASVVDIERHQRDMRMRQNASAQRVDAPATTPAAGESEVGGVGAAGVTASAAAGVLSRESSRQLSAGGGELLPTSASLDVIAGGDATDEDALARNYEDSAAEGATDTAVAMKAEAAGPLTTAESSAPLVPPSRGADSSTTATTNHYMKPLPGMPRPSGELLHPTQYITYSGYTSHSIPHIYGELWWGRRYYYRGGFCAGERHGFGVQYMPNGERYEGAFERDAWHGQGVYYLDDGAVIIGEFRRGELHVVRYHGEVEEDTAIGVRPHGRGIGYDPDGSLYNGEWSHGLRHGTGMLHFPDGVSVYSGTFVANEMEGMGKLVTTSGAYYGDFSHGQQHGRGLLFTATCVIEGSWERGSSSGFTRYYENSTGEVYETTSRDGNERDDCFSAPVMVDDAEAAECGQCGTTFSFFLRRHHCRLCGDVFCDACSQHRATLPANFGGNGDTGAHAESLHASISPNTVSQRVCDACFYRLTQRRMIGIRRYTDGSVYAGCWSQGRWVSRGLYCRPDGVYVVMDHYGRPLVSTDLTRAKMAGLTGPSSPTPAGADDGSSGTAAVGSDTGNAGGKRSGRGGVPAGGLGVSRRPARTKLPISSSILQDAAPAKELLDNVRLLRESSSRGDLDAFLLWWATTRTRCGLQVPLDVLLVSKYQRMPAQLLRGGKSATVSVGSDAATYLSGPTCCALATPHTPSLAPIHLFVTLEDSRKAMQAMVDGEVHPSSGGEEGDCARDVRRESGDEGASTTPQPAAVAGAAAGAAFGGGTAVPRPTTAERRVIDCDVEAAALRASRYMPVAIPRAPAVPITAATMPTLALTRTEDSPSLSRNASELEMEGSPQQCTSRPFVEADADAFGLSTWATRRPPSIDAEDISDEQLMAMMRAERLAALGTVPAAAATAPAVEPLMPPTPAPPALGANTPIAWEVWTTCEIPRYAPPPLTPVHAGPEVDAAAATTSSPAPPLQPPTATATRSEADLYFSCSFWDPAVPDVQTLLEQGKMTQAARLMRKLQRYHSHANGDGESSSGAEVSEEEEEDAKAASPWGPAGGGSSVARSTNSSGTAKEKESGNRDTLDVLQQMQVANGTGTGLSWSAGGLLSAEQRAQSGDGWAPAPMHGPFEFEISNCEKRKRRDGQRWCFKVQQREMYSFQ